MKNNKAVTKTISLPENYWQLIDKMSEETDIGRSGILAIAFFNFYQVKNAKGKLIYSSNLKRKILTSNKP